MKASSFFIATLKEAPAVAAVPDQPKEAPPAAKEEGSPRYVVQVGAYAEDAKVREVRAKLEKAGLKTYTQLAETKEGKRIRVRVGPFTSRDEADKAAARKLAQTAASATSAKPQAAAHKSNVVPAAPKLVTPTPVAASLIQAKPGATTVTSAVRGLFRTDAAARAEALQYIQRPGNAWR